LIEAFRDPLPGMEAHKKMWAPNRELLKEFSNNDSPRDAAVAAVFYPVGEDGAELILIKRTPDNSHHSGQISFPGGKAESYDRNLLETALREYREETGAGTDNLELIGVLSPLYIPVSNFMVHPHVFYTSKKPDFNHSREEVEKMLQVPFFVFTEQKYFSTFVMTWKGNDYTIPCFKYRGDIIWGATAMMIAELAEILK